jgi:hypothetical protein
LSVVLAVIADGLSVSQVAEVGFRGGQCPLVFGAHGRVEKSSVAQAHLG